MGLLPLELSDCLLDSPYFRENLRAHERQLDAASEDIKTITRCIREVTAAARSLSAAKRALADALSAFQFADCGGAAGLGGSSNDEIIIANSLRQFASFFNQVEDETDRLLFEAEARFQAPLESFRKAHLEALRKTKKELEKRTSRACAAQDRQANLSWRRAGDDAAAEAKDAARTERQRLEETSLQYVYLMHVVQERKKFEFVEAILGFMQSWADFHRCSHSVTCDFSPVLVDLQCRVQRTRDNFSATVEHFSRLKDRLWERRHVDPGAMNRMYARQGYLYRRRRGRGKGAGAARQPTIAGVAVSHNWIKCFAQFRKQGNALTLIDYSQSSSGGKITSTEAVRVTECACKEAVEGAAAAAADGAGGRHKFRFIVTGEDVESGSMVTHTFQALSDFDRRQWVEAMGGTWPPSVAAAGNPPQPLRGGGGGSKGATDSVEDDLKSAAFVFLQDCLAELEARGLRDHGLYRVGGVVSKVKRLLSVGLAEQSGSPLDLSDPKQWESKTIASAVKQYFRDLPKPLLTHQHYPAFLEAAKNPRQLDEEERAREVAAIVATLPRANRAMLGVLVRHLAKVAAMADVNLMTPANLGVCFGPTLLRPKEETVASIMDIKFCNEVVEVLIQHCQWIFPADEIGGGGGGAGGDSFTGFSNGRSGTQQRKMSSSAHSTGSMAVSTHGSLGDHDVVDDVVGGRAVRGGSTPHRTSSVGSFSQLSTNSLPDFKDFRSTSASSTKFLPALSRPAAESPKLRSRSHQHQPVMRSDGIPNLPARKQASLPSRSPQSELPPSPSRAGSLSQRSIKSSQDDLMASLEMMHLLAADLPSASAPRAVPLQRSYTLQPQPTSPSSSRHSSNDSHSSTFLDVFRKPPLPKVSATTTPASASSSQPYSTLFASRSNQSPSPSLSSNSGESASASPLLAAHSAAANSRNPPPPSPASIPAPGEFLSRMQEKLINRSRSNSIDNNCANGVGNSLLPSLTPPAVPVRKYRRIIVSPSSVQPEVKQGGNVVEKTVTTTVELRVEHERPEHHDRLEKQAEIGSPKCDDDNQSIISGSVLSFESAPTMAGSGPVPVSRLSRYENVTLGEDGDDEASDDGGAATAMSRSQEAESARGKDTDDDDQATLAGLSSEPDEEEQGGTRDGARRIAAFPTTEGDRVARGSPVSSSRPQRSSQRAVKAENRDSAYDNVQQAIRETDDDEETGEISETRHRDGSGHGSGTNEENLSAVQEGGITSLRRMLAVGQTSDV